jgi:hypothetical protein
MVLAELSVEEVSALAKKFLIGQADVQSGAKLQQVVDEDPTAALELLTQMQDALDHVSPYGLNPDQWKDVDFKVLPVIQGRARKSGGGLFAGLFGGRGKRAAKPKATKVKRRSSSPALTGRAEKKKEEVKAEEAASETEAAALEEGGGSTGVIVMAVLLLLAAGAGGAYWWFFARVKPQPPRKAVVVLPTPTPTASPTPNLGARRGVPPPPMQDAPVPAEIPPATPKPAGQVNLD